MAERNALPSSCEDGITEAQATNIPAIMVTESGADGALYELDVSLSSFDAEAESLSTRGNIFRTV